MLPCDAARTQIEEMQLAGFTFLGGSTCWPSSSSFGCWCVPGELSGGWELASDQIGEKMGKKSTMGKTNKQTDNNHNHRSLPSKCKVSTLFGKDKEKYQVSLS